MDSIGDVAGSAIIGVGGVINMMLAAVGSGGLAGSLSENVYLPLLGSVAPGFTLLTAGAGGAALPGGAHDPVR